MSNLKLIFDANIKNYNINLIFNNFIFVYNKYTKFSKQYITKNIENDILGKNIRVKVDNYGDFLGKIILQINLPKVSVSKKIQDTNLNLSYEKNNLDNFNLYINFILIAYKKIYTFLKLENISVDNIKNEINNIFNSSDFNIFFEIENNINNNFIIKNLNIKNNILKIIDDNSEKTNIKVIELINSYLNNILYKIKLYHKLYFYDNYITKKKINDSINLNTYNFSWIENIGKFIIDEVSLVIDSNKVETIYNDFLNIWDELTLNQKKKKNNDIILGNIDSLKNYDNLKKNEYDIYINLNFWFTRKSYLLLPLFLINRENIYLDIKFNKLSDLIYTDYDDQNNKLEDLIKINNNNLILEYFYIENKEKLNLKTNYNSSVINIYEKYTKKININNIINNDLNINQLTYDLNINYPLSELIIVIQSNNLIKKYNLKNNYYGVKKINSINNNYYFLQKENLIQTLDNIEIYIDNKIINNIKEIDFYNKLTSFKFHNNINDSIYIYTFSLFPENNQPSGHINLSSNNKFKINIVLNNNFINFLKNEFNSNDTLIISTFINLNKKINYINNKFNFD